MQKLKIIIFTISCLCIGLKVSHAQVLDELEETEDETLFNELFSDYSETERDVTKVKTFEDAIEQTSKLLKQVTPKKNEKKEQVDVTPIQGDLKIGITKGSFKISKHPVYDVACSFSVTLKSTLNKKIHLMALNLIYDTRTFAFVFKELPENGTQKSYIRTSGDICYNLTGTPDIDINKCKIIGADRKECASRILWDDNLNK